MVEARHVLLRRRAAERILVVAGGCPGTDGNDSESYGRRRGAALDSMRDATPKTPVCNASSRAR